MIEISRVLDHLQMLQKLGANVPNLYWKLMKSYTVYTEAANGALELATETLCEALNEAKHQDGTAEVTDLDQDA